MRKNNSKKYLIFEIKCKLKKKRKNPSAKLFLSYHAHYWLILVLVKSASSISQYK